MEEQKPKKLLDHYREQIRLKQYSHRTEETYVKWVRQYIRFHNPGLSRGEINRHPREMREPEIQQFITHLVVERQASASTQNQAISAILFLYRAVLRIEIDESALNFIRPKKGKRVPVVLSKEEARAVIANMRGSYKLMAQIMYGSGLRLTPALAPQRSAGASVECLRLCVKDIDFGNRQIIVRDGKGEDDRVTILPDSLILDLQRQIQTVQHLHQTDLADGFGEVWLPYALACKYPNASRGLIWQYLFPASSLSRDPRHPSLAGKGAGGRAFPPLPLGEGLGVRAKSAATMPARVSCKKPFALPPKKRA